VGADLKARGTGQIKIDEPRLPHIERRQIGQQKELGRKRLELVAIDLKTTRHWSDHDPIDSIRHTRSTSSVARCTISLGNEQMLLL
jgi:hypothetical protein